MIETSMLEFMRKPRLAFDMPTRPVDFDAMVAIHAEGFPRGWSIDEFEQLVADPTVMTLLLRRGSWFGSRSVAGFALLRRVADEAEVLTLGVAAARRGRGHGRLIMEEAMRRLYAEGIATVFLEVSESNPAALALYRRLGFAEVGRRKGYYADGGPGAAALVMRLQLR